MGNIKPYSVKSNWTNIDKSIWQLYHQLVQSEFIFTGIRFKPFECKKKRFEFLWGLASEIIVYHIFAFLLGTTSIDREFEEWNEDENCYGFH